MVKTGNLSQTNKLSLSELKKIAPLLYDSACNFISPVSDYHPVLSGNSVWTNYQL